MVTIVFPIFWGRACYAQLSASGMVILMFLTITHRTSKGESMNTTTLKPRWPIRPLTWREGCEILRTKFTDHAHWLIVIHGSAARLLIEIEERYYAGEKNQDFTLI